MNPVLRRHALSTPFVLCSALILVWSTCPCTPAIAASAPAWTRTDARAWIKNGSSQAKAQLQASAKHDHNPTRKCLANFVLAVGETRRVSHAPGWLSAIAGELHTARRCASLADAATWTLGQAQFAAHDTTEAEQTLTAFGRRYPESPFITSAIWTLARAAQANKNWAVELSALHRNGISGPEPLFMAAEAERQLGQKQLALQYYRRLFWEFPASWGAPDAQRWITVLTGSDPLSQASGTQWRERAEGFMRAGRYADAAASFDRAAQLWPGEQAMLTLAQARAEFLAGGGAQPAARLKALLAANELTRGERAQALELQVRIARRLNDLGQVQRSLVRLQETAPHSRWLLDGLLEAADNALLQNDLLLAQAHFDRMADWFPDTSAGATAEWRAAWFSYRLDQPDAPTRMERYISDHPNGGAVPDALFWRGLWAYGHGEHDLAAQCWSAAARLFPGSYFGELAARSRLQHGLPAVKTLPAFAAGLRAAPGPSHGRPLPARFAPTLSRARLFASAYLRQQGRVVLLPLLRQLPYRLSLTEARPLAELERALGNYPESAVLMERAVPDFLRLPYSALSTRDWRLLYPFPYRQLIERAAQQNDVDPALIGGLIRQESLFNRTEISRAHAIGLMQLLLGTAQFHRRVIDVRRVSVADLRRPEMNIPLGVAELQSLMVQFPRAPEYAVAGYNAGGNRVQQWLAQNNFTSPAEFTESIPFQQTRAYVQAVLRNELAYRHIYHLALRRTAAAR